MGEEKGRLPKRHLADLQFLNVIHSAENEVFATNNGQTKKMAGACENIEK